MNSPNETSTPILSASRNLTEETIQDIKERVVKAASAGLSDIAHGGLQHQHSTSTLSTYAANYSGNDLLSARSRLSDASARHASSNAAAHKVFTSTPSSANTVQLRQSSNIWNFHDRDLFPFHRLGQIQSVVPLADQEPLVVSELLHCLVGIRGAHIVPMVDAARRRTVNATVSCANNDVDNTRGGDFATDDDAIADRLMDAVRFNVSDHLHASLRTLVQDIVPLASDYACLQHFVQLSAAAHIGQVQQALGAAIRRLLFDYAVFLVQLERQQLAAPLTLARLLFLVRPTMAVFRTLCDLLRPVHTQQMAGPQILGHLYDSITSLSGATPAMRAIVVQLTQSAARPYMDMLHLWIHKGIIRDDQGGEFLVADNEHIRTDFIHIDHYSAEYWEKRYTIRPDRVPRFLRTHADRVLRAGKYLNVIRQCGDADTAAPLDAVGGDAGTTETTVAFDATDDRVHEAAIEAAYTRAARTLLRVLVHDADLMGHLQSVKRYLLLHQGDFINQFMDAAETELAKNVDRVQPMRLDSLLGLTLRCASTKYDRYNDDLHCQLFPFELCKQMEQIHLAGTPEDEWHWHQQHREEKINLTGLECFAFRYEVCWPVSLVLNHFAVLEYQMLFRQLFYCKHVERQLCKVWKDNNNAKKFAPTAAELYRSAFTLRQRMMSAVQNIEYYMMIEVIEPTWHEFVGRMDTVSNVDEVLLAHQEFLDDCLYNCMLKTPELLRAVTKLCNICLGFCRFIQKAQEHFVDAELTSMLRSDDSTDSDSDMEQSGTVRTNQTESSMAPTETFSERIKRFDLEFTFVLIGLLKQINEISYENPNSKLINLVHRINFNSFYSIHLEQMSCKTAKNSARKGPPDE